MYVVKGMLIVFVVTFLVFGAVIFAGLLVREVWFEIRARRSARAKLLSQNVPLDYNSKESPTWERSLDFAQRRALASKLAELGE